MISNKNKVFYWVPALIWMWIIFMFSSQPASDSNELSVGVTKILVEILGKILPLNIETSTISNIVIQLNHIIRKLAHFSIYMVLGILVYGAIIKNGILKKELLISLIICIIYAVSDELHQLFVPGRGCQLKDVFIDSTGAFNGILISKLVFKKKKLSKFSK